MRTPAVILVLVTAGCTAGAPIGRSEQASSTTGPVFLVENGVGTAATTRAYYSDNGVSAGSYTVDQFRADSLGGQPLVRGFYRNAHELGFWRDMTCSSTIGRGFGGCMVTNWRDSDATPPTAGTVAMRLDSSGVTQFLVFGPDGTLSPTAVLDSEGAKFVPQICTVCHAGYYDGTHDLGSVFREFDPSRLERRPGVPQPVAETEWFALNQAVRSANQAIRAEAEGAPFGTDHARQAQVAHVDAMYPTGAPPARAGADPLLTPASWLSAGPPARQEAWKSTLWTSVVAPYCMPCHRSNGYDWSSYGDFLTLASGGVGNSLLRRLITVDPNDPARARLPFMPQAQLTFDQLGADGIALTAVDTWEAAMSTRSRVTFTLGGVPAQAGSRVLISGDAAELGAFNLNDALPLAAAGATWTATLTLPRGVLVYFKAAVIDGAGNIVWEGGPNRTLLVPNSLSTAARYTWVN